MSQHDYDIANGTGAAVRGDINDVLEAIQTNNSGAEGDLPNTKALMFFADTTNNVMKIRNAANNGFESLFTFAGGPAFEVDGTINSVNIGKGTNSISTNTVLGSSALDAAVSGSANTAVGSEALTDLQSGAQNVAVGASSLADLVGGSENTAVGQQSLFKANSAQQCTAVGRAAMNDNTSGSQNTACGCSALADNVDSNHSTAVGFNALRLSTGQQNTAVGSKAGDIIVSGENNLTLGYNADPSSNSASNQVTLGDVNITSLRCADDTISTFSDERDKTDIVNLPVGLEFINSLLPRKYKWKTREGSNKDGSVRAGFIAQELQKTQEGFEYLDLVMDDNPDKLEIKQGKLIPVLVKAIQELSAKVQALETA